MPWHTPENGWAFQGLGKVAPLACAIRLMLDQENPSSVTVTELANAELSSLGLRLSLHKYGWLHVSGSVYHWFEMMRSIRFEGF
jgi:hypothetical protein